MMEGPRERVDASMIKIGPVGNSVGQSWDQRGRSEIVQIFVSHGQEICSLQFQYSEDGEFVLSRSYGSNSGSNFDAVTLEYPSEYLTCVSGIKTRLWISAITFTTNRRTYGPFGGNLKPDWDNQFRFELGKHKQFGGFYGSADNCLRSIGVYLKPIRTLNIQQNQNHNGGTHEEAGAFQILLQ